MRQPQREQLEQEIYTRIIGDDSPAESRRMFQYQEPITLMDISKHVSGIIGQGFYSHEHAAQIVERITNFYNRITPEEITFLNAQVYRCPHCKEQLDRDEYYPVSSFPNHMGITVMEHFDDSALSGVCKQCTYLAPIQLSSNKDRKGFAYLAYWPSEQLYKIGASKTPENRMSSLQRQYKGIELSHRIPAGDMWVAESQLLSRFLHRHVKNELFDLTPEDVGFIVRVGVGS